MGTGFHPELTGRENIFLNGSILGMTRNEITRQFDAIVAFAGVENFLDTPVKRYSSGMQVRLAFAVAAHLETEILLLDEVLAVGDATFQEKCLAKVAELATTGRTAVIVSHNASLVERVATQAVLLDRGQLAMIGSPAEVLEGYSTRLPASAPRADVATARRIDSGLGTRVRITDIRPLTERGEFTRADGVRFAITLAAHESLDGLVVSMSVHTADGAKLGSVFAEPAVAVTAGTETEIAVHLPEPPLAPGTYLLGVAIGLGGETGNFVDLLLDAMQFEIAPAVRPDGRVEAWDDAWGTIAFPSARAETLTVGPPGSTGSPGSTRPVESTRTPSTG